VVGFAVALGCAGVVYRDATRLEISRPALWAGIVFATCGGALALYLAPPDVPDPRSARDCRRGPGALYLFERDDTKHGDEPPDPHSLPEGPGGESSSERQRDE